MTPSALLPAPGFLRDVFDRLLHAFGPMGWWPLDHRAGQEGFDKEGYHPAGYPADFGVQDAWCIFLGVVLTQRSSWNNARRGVAALMAGVADLPGSLASHRHEDIAPLVRSSGFYNQKTRRLFSLESLLVPMGFFDPREPCPSRDAIGGLKGLGQESTDALRVYGRLEPGFVSDAYTSRIFARLAGSAPEPGYADCRQAVLEAWNVEVDDEAPGLPLGQARERLSDSPALQELQDFHALLVELGKRNCSPDPRCGDCPVRTVCAGGRPCRQ